MKTLEKISEILYKIIIFLIPPVIAFSSLAIGYIIGCATTGLEEQSTIDSNAYKIESLEKDISSLYERIREDERQLSRTIEESAYTKSAIDALTKYLKDQMKGE